MLLTGCGSEEMSKETVREEEYVWYACYGSNINEERFMKYINRCTDQTPPVEDRPYEFPHNIYFAKSSKTWDEGAVAFLDDTTEGKAYGRIYKIKKEQYEEVQQYEGSNYKKRLEFDKIDDIPVYSFTDVEKNDEIRLPSYRYFRVILDGLYECYGGINDKVELGQYLISKVMPEESFIVAKTMAESPDEISNQKIAECTDLDIEQVYSTVNWLLEHQVIQQHEKSISAGHVCASPEALFCLVESAVGTDLINEMICRILNSSINQ